MNKVLNQIFFITVGFFLGLIYLLVWMKLLNLWGIILGVILSILIYKFAKKQLAVQTSSSLNLSLKQINQGFIVCNIFILIVAIIVGSIFYSSIQGLIN